MTESVITIDSCVRWLPPPGDREAPVPEAVRLHGLDPAQPFAAASLLRELYAAGITRGAGSAIVFAPGPAGADAVAALIAAHPGRCIGQVTVSPPECLGAVRELKRAVRDLGLTGGLRLEPYRWGLPPTDRLYYPLFAACCELGVPVTLHVGQTTLRYPSEPGRPLYIDRVALDFPELTIVCSHLGWPWADEMVAMAWKHPRVFISTAGYPPERYPPFFVHFLRSFGQEKVLFGSDWPLLSIAEPRRHLAALDLPPLVAEKFLGGNAARVFGV